VRVALIKIMLLEPSSIIVGFSILMILTAPSLGVFATESNFSDDINSNFTKNLKSKINDLVSSALNGPEKFVNSSILLSNNSNLSSNQIVISNNKIVSTMNSNGSDSNSLIRDKVTTINGICNSEKVAGAGNDTLLSSGNCNDELTGGPGADKFQCGEGKDTIKDFNPKEGDVILDKHNCETIQ
jgi:Ca2+-binding RTX toxin-like protein